MLVQYFNPKSKAIIVMFRSFLLKHKWNANKLFSSISLSLSKIQIFISLCIPQWNIYFIIFIYFNMNCIYIEAILVSRKSNTIQQWSWNAYWLWATDMLPSSIIISLFHVIYPRHLERKTYYIKYGFSWYFQKCWNINIYG